ncbi:MAG TPA: hypothetical protein VK157_05860, partial [Phycisphaerales bacterium]|nr:hypothetical protein [Phycisphaerales bacterium]
MLRTSFLVVPALLASTGMAQVTLTPLPVVEGETAVTGDGTLDISADGTLAIGLVSTPGGTPYAVVWRKLQGQWRRATLPALPCMVFGNVALSADGDSAVGGKCFSSQSAYIWTNLRSGFPTLLEVPFGSEYIAPRAVSNGASVLTGQSFNTGFLRSNGTVSTLTPRPEHALSIGVAMSADGSVILGLSWTWPDFGSNLWNSSNQIIATFAANHTPGALTSDGLTAVGYIATTPGEDGGDVPAYWQNGVVATQFPAPQGFPP